MFSGIHSAKRTDRLAPKAVETGKKKTAGAANYELSRSERGGPSNFGLCGKICLTAGIVGRRRSPRIAPRQTAVLYRAGAIICFSRLESPLTAQIAACIA